MRKIHRTAALIAVALALGILAAPLAQAIAIGDRDRLLTEECVFTIE